MIDMFLGFKKLKEGPIHIKQYIIQIDRSGG
jgi:hypothetical protein